MVEWVEESKIPHLDIMTIAGHDALQVQSVCPSTLLFIPSKDGISHAPEEFTSDEALLRSFAASLTAITSLISHLQQTQALEVTHV